LISNISQAHGLQTKVDGPYLNYNPEASDLHLLPSYGLDGPGLGGTDETDLFAVGSGSLHCFCPEKQIVVKFDVTALL